MKTAFIFLIFLSSSAFAKSPDLSDQCVSLVQRELQPNASGAFDQPKKPGPVPVPNDPGISFWRPTLVSNYEIKVGPSQIAKSYFVPKSPTNLEAYQLILIQSGMFDGRSYDKDSENNIIRMVKVFYEDLKPEVDYSPGMKVLRIEQTIAGVGQRTSNFVYQAGNGKLNCSLEGGRPQIVENAKIAINSKSEISRATPVRAAGAGQGNGNGRQ